MCSVINIALNNNLILTVVIQANNSERKQLRQQLRKARQSLSTEQQQDASIKLLNNIVANNIVDNAQICAFYLANDGELNPKPLIEYCWSKGVKTSLPVIHPFAKGHLLFLQYSANSKMCSNQYGIDEPVCELPDIVPLTQHQLIFTPLVGFDLNGNRLGMGGGYYDRTLSSLKQQANISLIGLAHDCQQVDALPQENWDIPVNKIITPSRIINC
ncbi:5-formyltetrahydrofolate cyclo-ligase [Planctobacterium marinum]|uniref:5-formyltetrahydrofolate cyclo-ligase n=1 Tax=Planctobacterium marinum TaxID=1631968 RepID=A0AA48HJF1_9ALTE|nr:5-formyltetrahydrofolate cyclo-ligase [Planctobacterium marinum]